MYKKQLLAIFFLIGFLPLGKAQTNSLESRKTVEPIGCNECNLEKKLKKCFIVKSYVGNVNITSADKKGIKFADDANYDKDTAVRSYLFCALEKYQEIMISAGNHPSLTVNITPYDFELGTPIIHVYSLENNPFAETGKSLFEEMAELEEKGETAEVQAPTGFSAPGKTAEQPIYMQKRFDQAVCDYCLPEGKKYRCLMIISSLKGGKLMDGEERILHKKALKINDSTRQYVFCLKPNEYKQYLFKAKGYQNGTVEIIPQDFANNRTPIITFYKEAEKKYYESDGKVGSLYSEKSNDRWVESPCGMECCVYVYSHLSNLVLNDNASVIEPYETEKFSTKIWKYTYCVDPESKTFMVSKPDYNSCLLKLKFEDLESEGGTAFVVSENQGQLSDLSQQILNDRLTRKIVVEEVKPEPVISTPKAPEMEYRVQLVAKILDNYDAEKIKKSYNVPSEVKEDYDGMWHRFTFGSYPTPEQAEEALKEFKQKHPSEDAFIVIYKNGKRVGLFKK